MAKCIYNSQMMKYGPAGGFLEYVFNSVCAAFPPKSCMLLLIHLSSVHNQNVRLLCSGCTVQMISNDMPMFCHLQTNQTKLGGGPEFESHSVLCFYTSLNMPAFRSLSLYCWSSFFILFWYSCSVPAETKPHLP